MDILGHIFEQSITDLERIRSELDTGAAPTGMDEQKSRRKKEGAFYTPAFITRYNVGQALGGVLRDRFEQLRRNHHAEAKATARAVLENPSVYLLDKLTRPQREALVRFWEAWQGCQSRRKRGPVSRDQGATRRAEESRRNGGQLAGGGMRDWKSDGGVIKLD